MLSLCILTNLLSDKVLNWVRDQAEKEADLQQYVPHLQSNTILRLLQQVILLILMHSPGMLS